MRLEDYYDPHMQVVLFDSTQRSQTTTYAALHQDYCADFVGVQPFNKDEQTYGEWAINALLDSKRNHWGPFEHAQVVLSVGYVNHATFQQYRTHRNVSYDCQSMRYSSEHFLKAAAGEIDIEKAVYLRPVGTYYHRKSDRHEPQSYQYTEGMREDDLQDAMRQLKKYAARVKQFGFAPEHARSILLFDYRQHFFFSGNLRSFFHLLDMRGGAGAELEAQYLAWLMIEAARPVAPEFVGWYEKYRWRKAILAP